MENNNQTNSEKKIPISWENLERLGIGITWAWPKWLPKGFVTLLVGGVGLGKSTIALRICASFLTGMDWLDGTKYEDEPGYVIWCEAESGHFMNVERARRWHLPIKKILSPLEDASDNFYLSYPEHRNSLEEVADTNDVKLIVIDSARGAIEGDENNSDFIQQLKYLANLAQKKQIPILLIHHLRKKSKFESTEHIELDSIRGSSAIAQIPRVVIAVYVPNLDYPDKRKLEMIKCNLGKFPDPIGITITDHGIEIVPIIDSNANHQSTTQRELAKDFIKDFLKDGFKPSTVIYDEGAKKGLDRQTLQRAKKELGIIVRKEGRIWVWGFKGNKELPLI